jgi:stage II sporulation protein D
MRFMLTFLISLYFHLGFSQDLLRIGILEKKNQEKFELKTEGSSFTVTGGDFNYEIPSNIFLTIAANGTGFNLQLPDTLLRLLSNKITFNSKAPEGKLTFVWGSPSRKQSYPYIIECNNISGKIKLVNVIPMDEYIAGVIEAEGGPKHDLEYYKAQAVISRTYVLSQYHKHIDDRFNLCDQTHCQAYNGWPKYEQIMMDAALQTKSLVIVDENVNLITSAFHSNCGGRTNSAEYVWSRRLPYCEEKIDTFCMKMPNSNWEKRIPLDQWKKYISSKNLATSDSANYAYFPTEKEVYYREGSTKIPLVQMRKDLKLKSTYFAVHQDGEEMVIIGQGFGHGVGLCQEGSMRMAQLGYSYEDIIHFYYANVKIIPFQYIAFFKQD